MSLLQREEQTTEEDSGGTPHTAMTTQNPENSESISKEENEKLIPPLRPRYSFGREVLLTLNALVIMPMYTMLIGLWIYTAMVYFAPTLWLRSLLLLYIPYIVLWDSSPSNGRRPFGNRSACRSVRCYKWFAQYFDMKLVKTCDLDPKKNYIMLYHPHGIISVGANTALNTNGCDFESIFPGLERAGVTLNETFWAPFLRDWILRMGYISANKHTLHEALQVQSIVLVPGGAAEALHARPGVMKLYLNKRKGFVRLAMETNCPIVPCIGFGENEIYNAMEPGSLQHDLSKFVHFSIPILKNIVPRRAKLTVVVGEPLDFGTETDVDKCHTLYVQHLKLLYDKEKSKYGYEHIKLELI